MMSASEEEITPQESAPQESSPQVSLDAPLMPSREQYVHKTAAVGFTDFLKSNLSFTWKVIVKPLVENGCELRSPTFKVPLPTRGDEERREDRSSFWHLELKSSRRKYNVFLYFEGERSEYVDVDSEDEREPELVNARSKFCIVECKYSILEPRTDQVQYFSVDSELCQSRGVAMCSVCGFFMKDGLDEVTLDGVLTMKVIACLVYFMDPVQATIEAAASPVMPNNVFNNLKKLNVDKSFADVSIKCGGKEFKAHKAILASQSPVFSKMFETDMKDNVVEVADIDPDVMSDLLDFLYTGTAPNLHTLAKDLLCAASEYKLHQLAVLCENELMLNLYVDNLVEMVQCADTYGAVNLKQACLRMMKSNSVELFKSGAWKKFKATASEQDLIYEVLEYKEDVLI